MIRSSSSTTSVSLFCALLALTLGAACSVQEPSRSGRVVGVHMAELSADFSKVYLTSTEEDEVLVVDATAFASDTSADALLNRAYVVSRHSSEVDVIDLRTLELVSKSRDYPILARIPVGAEPTHLSFSRDRNLLAVMTEADNAVSFIDTLQNREVKRLPGFFTPHFMRFSADGRYGYVANIAANHLSRVDMETLEIDAHIPLEGFAGPPNETLAEDEGGFGDAQIDADGMLFAAHAATGRVLVYDTIAKKKKGELTVGARPWIAFAEHPFHDLPRRPLVPNFGDRTVSIIDGKAGSVLASLPGDEEAYGVNFTSRAPDKAFVMNRKRQDVAVVDTANGAITARIPVGGNTETAATTADGKYIVAAVSGANRVVIIDALSNRIVRTFDNVGNYPWSVTIPNGQNYCH